MQTKLSLYNILKRPFHRKLNILPVIFIALSACSSTPVTPHTSSVQEINNLGANEYAVQCLLPGKIRKMGSNFTYLSPSRTVETSESDCNIRGGQVLSEI